MNEDDHLSIARLEKCVFDVIVENVDFVSSDWSISKAIDVSFENAAETFLDNIRSNVEIFEFGISSSLIGD